jgi:hypothetical protein
MYHFVVPVISFNGASFPQLVSLELHKHPTHISNPDSLLRRPWFPTSPLNFEITQPNPQNTITSPYWIWSLTRQGRVEEPQHVGQLPCCVQVRMLCPSVEELCLRRTWETSSLPSSCPVTVATSQGSPNVQDPRTETAPSVTFRPSGTKSLPSKSWVLRT